MDDLVPGEEIYYEATDRQGHTFIKTGIFDHYSVPLRWSKGRTVWAYWGDEKSLGWMPEGEVFRVKPKKVEYNDEEWV